MDGGRSLAVTLTPSEEPQSIPKLPKAPSLQVCGSYTALSIFQSFLSGLNFAKWSSSMPLLCSFMKYESGSRVSCLVSPRPNPSSLAPSLAAAVGLVSISPDRDGNEFCSGQASSDLLVMTANSFDRWSSPTGAVYPHCKPRCLQRWQGVSPSHSKTFRLHSRQPSRARLR